MSKKTTTPPETSIQAFKMLTNEMRSSHYGKIMSAMRILSIPSSMEAIAEKAGMGLAQVSRRMSELQADSIVKTDGIGFTSSGRKCNLYALINHTTTSPTIAASNVFVQREMF